MALTLQDRLDILELAARYNKAVDGGDVEGWLALWTDDGVFETSFGTFKGKEALRNFMKFYMATSKGNRHVSVNPVMEGDGDSATLACDLLLVRTPGMPSLFATGTYTDALRKVGGAWKFQRRKLALDSMEWMKAVPKAAPASGPKPG